MPTINTTRTNTVPLWLLVSCTLLVVARFGCIFYDTVIAPPMVNLVQWETFNPQERPATETDLLKKPILYLFVDEREVLDKVRWQLAQGTIFQNRHVASLMKDKFRCIKVVLTGKDDRPALALAKKFQVNAFPEVVVSLPNNEPVETSCLQFTDRLFAVGLEQAQVLALKTAGDASMARSDFRQAIAAYHKFLAAKGADDSKNLHAVLRYYIACKKLGRDSQAKTILASYPTTEVGGIVNCFDYLKGKMTQEQLWNSYGKNGDPTTVKYIIAMNNIFQGNKPEAEKNLLWIARHGDNISPDYNNAMAEMKTMGIVIPPRPTNDDELEDDLYAAETGH